MKITNSTRSLAAALTLSTALLAGAKGAVAYQLAGTSGLASDAYWISLMCGGTKAAESAGSKIDWYAVKNGSDAAEAAANFEALKVANPDGVVISQFSAEPPAGYVKELMDKGIPVVYTNGQPAKDRSYMTATSPRLPIPRWKRWPTRSSPTPAAKAKWLFLAASPASASSSTDVGTF